MKKIFKTCLTVISLFFFMSMACYAESNTAARFDLDAANKQLDEINIKLSTQNLELESLKKAVNELEEMEETAGMCAALAKEELDKLNAEKYHTSKKANTGFSQYLAEKRNAMLTRASECQLFSLRASEHIAALKNTLQKMKTTELLSRTEPVWTLISTKTFQENNLSFKETYAKFGVSQLSVLSLLIIAGLFVFSFFSGKTILQKIQALSSSSHIVHILRKKLSRPS